MRKFLLGFVLALLAGAAVAFAETRTYTLDVAQNLTRPCSYRGKVAVTLAVTAVSAATASPLPAGQVRVICTSASHFRLASTSPTAVVTDTLITANSFPEFIVSEGDYFAAIRDTADGVCYLTACR